MTMMLLGRLKLSSLTHPHGCIVLSNILSICCSFVRRLTDLSWIAVDLPRFSEARFFTSWYTLVLFLFWQSSISSHRIPIQSSLAFFHCLPNLFFFFASLYFLSPSVSYRLLFQSLLSHYKITNHMIFY